jgi:hypothetical protein
MRIIALAMAIAALAGCATIGKEHKVAETVDTVNADYGPRPANHEEVIKNWANENLKDPESALYGKISKPRKEFLVRDLKPYFGWSVCADINAKNSFGGYTGSKTFWFFIRDERIQRSQSTEGSTGTMISSGHFINCTDGDDSDN